jgi:hypothetical protein
VVGRDQLVGDLLVLHAGADLLDHEFRQRVVGRLVHQHVAEIALPEGETRRVVELLEESLALLRRHVGRMAGIGGVDEAAPVLAALREDLVVARADVGHRLGLDLRVAQRRAPVGRALEHREMPHRFGDLGDGLHARGAGADHGDALAFEADGMMRPQAGMPGLALEILDTGNGRHGRRRQRSDRGDEETRSGTASGLERHFPFVGGVIPMRSLHAGVEGDVAAQVELVGQELAVAQILGLAGEMLLPVPFLQHFRREGEAVGPALRIEAGAGIAVPVPGAADAAARLIDARPETHLAQLQQLVHARQAGADDDDVPMLDGVPDRARRRRFSRNAHGFLT